MTWLKKKSFEEIQIKNKQPNCENIVKKLAYYGPKLFEAKSEITSYETIIFWKILIKILLRKQLMVGSFWNEHNFNVLN